MEVKMIKSGSHRLALIVALVAVVLSFTGVADALQGGPDKFGYRYIDSYEKNGPEYELAPFLLQQDENFWDHKKGVGYSDLTKKVSNHTLTQGFPIGFDFEFYGKKYNYFYISGNGYVTFTFDPDDYKSNVYEGQVIPSSSAPNTLIAPFWSHNNVET
ncbi:MAG: hypothetical protein U9Q39_02345 [Pseudomonadota bacterium]|nr:hypothetical protein [Pseudomonadota bacterium]